MTREEALETLIDNAENGFVDIEEIKLVFAELEQKSCEDTISRQAVLEGKVIHQSCDGVEINNSYAVPVEYIEHLPSIQPKTEWVLCSERLPKIRFDLNSRTSDTVFVCLENSTRHMAFYCDDGVWRFCESGEAKEPMWDKVIAWQPLPQSYKIESER